MWQQLKDLFHLEVGAAEVAEHHGLGGAVGHEALGVGLS